MKPRGTPPRGLSDAEAAVWARVAASVIPLRPAQPPATGRPTAAQPPRQPVSRADKAVKLLAARPPDQPGAGSALPRIGADRGAAHPGLDSHWERRLRAGTLLPDFTLDLHDYTLDAAYHRLLGGLDIARETGARVVLVIAGRERPAAAADRSTQRGAIRAKLLDWLAASRHSGAIAAVRKAHRRHGGEGALYVILKKSG